ncbi:hypothetical protein H696_02085 [Fonticula alba]|uniref:Endonuclease V n=1 Tax=Fonticula alba TaxID=691883 RepID=A0A058ZA12_FONAL|nr:hypothetical protein H696_02085 [Fonticula alba]KCV71134.1 hypothetical protein H696_02085 [Fonticula alba]|eukprot:XP_009494257.1 hypothetical protein H696_02085 [Fonticula alba]
MRLAYEASLMTTVEVEYIPGFLAFRESPPLQQLLEHVRQSSPTHFPDMLLVDGNGLLHERSCGLASYLGVQIDLPTIGVSKTFFKLPGIEAEDVSSRAAAELTQSGSFFDLIDSSGRVKGRAMRATKKSSRPIFVSVGHRVSLDTAVRVVHGSCEFRLPEPIRHADQVSRTLLKAFCLNASTGQRPWSLAGGPEFSERVFPTAK